MSADTPHSDSALSEIMQKLVAITESLAEQRSHDSAREAAFDSLHQDLVSQREDRDFQARKGFIRRMVRFYNRVDEVRALAEVRGENTDRFDDLLQTLQCEFEEEDIYPIPHSIVFDRSVHHAIDQRETNEPEFDGKVAAVHQRGFTFRSRVILETQVTVYRFVGGKSH